MFKDFRKNKTFNRRSVIIGGLQFGLLSTLVARLGYLQIFQHKEYTIKSDGNRIRPLVAPASRGIILDRNDQALSKNNKNYRLLLYTQNKASIETDIEALSQILLLSQAEQEAMMEKIKNSRQKNIISLIDNLSWDDISRIESNFYKLKGVTIEAGIARFYPFGYQTAHLIGYVSLPSQKEIIGQEQSLFLHPDFRIGKAGIERSFDEVLRGKFGVKYVEVNAFNIPVRNLSKKASIEGSKINLTIDIRLQNFIYERIQNLVASVVVIDVKTGEIIALVSNPSFDPNKLVEGISKQYWDELTSDQSKPMSNKAISANYPPGSTFKLMTAIAALENNINPEKKVFCNGSYKIGNRTFHCWKQEGHGLVDMSDAIKHSCNVYFFDVSNQIGINPIMQTAKRFGYGEYFDISLFGVKTGNLPSKEWKQKVFKQAWVGGDTLNTAIGQGFVLASPLQMAIITARVANGGVPIKPYLVKNRNIYSQFDQLKNQPLANQKNIQIVLEGMNRVVNEIGGTAYSKRIEDKNFAMIGKTGTSQIISKRENEMSGNEAIKNKNHAIFIGAAPANEPKFAISVAVEHGGSGSGAAAPIGRDILLELQKILQT